MFRHEIITVYKHIIRGGKNMKKLFTIVMIISIMLLNSVSFASAATTTKLSEENSGDTIIVNKGDVIEIGLYDHFAWDPEAWGWYFTGENKYTINESNDNNSLMLTEKKVDFYVDYHVEYPYTYKFVAQNEGTDKIELTYFVGDYSLEPVTFTIKVLP